MKKEVNIKISGMHCNSCAKTIESGLSALEGIEKAEVNFADENAAISFDSEKISHERIEEEIKKLGYSTNPDSIASKPMPKQGASLKQGLIYGLVPHIGCIGFIAASILGVTFAIEFFKPLLMNPWFFHILIAISIIFATISSIFYLKKQGILSFAGMKRKKKYLSTMYGATIGINLFLFFAVFPMLANIDTGSFANTGAIALAGNLGSAPQTITLAVDIPCPGHAPLISRELKTIDGVTGVQFEFPNNFNVAFDTAKTSKEEILSLEVFKTYKATLTSESKTIASTAAGLEASGVKETQSNTGAASSSGSVYAAGSCSSCGASGSSSTCGASGGTCGCGAR